MMYRELETLSGDAHDILLSAKFDGVNWVSCPAPADVVQELIGARAAIQSENGLSITGRGMNFRHLLKSVKYRPAARVT